MPNNIQLYSLRAHYLTCDKTNQPKLYSMIAFKHTHTHTHTHTHKTSCLLSTFNIKLTVTANGIEDTQKMLKIRGTFFLARFLASQNSNASVQIPIS